MAIDAGSGDRDHHVINNQKLVRISYPICVHFTKAPDLPKFDRLTKMDEGVVDMRAHRVNHNDRVCTICIRSNCMNFRHKT